MSKFSLSWCLEWRNYPVIILLQALWRDLYVFRFFRLRVVVGQTATVSSFGGLLFSATSLLLCPSTLC
jgi:hypothetical protein